MVTGPAKRAEPRRLYQQIADQIRALIRNGQFPPLSRLPAERDLAQQLGVSRPSLREALIALEIEGSVDIRMGSGVYVCDSSGQMAEITRAMGDSPFELMQARSAIEGVVVILACARMTAPFLATLAASLQRMRAAVDNGQSPQDDDRLFHITIAHQAGNSVLARIVGDLFDERHSQISTKISTKFETGATWAEALAEHEAIYAAIEAADALLAQAAMCRHLHQSAARWVADR